MKNFKRILALVLAVMMVATSVVAISAAEADEKVVYNAEAITRLNKLGIFQGYNAEDMGADDDVTRAQMALFTGRVLTGKVESNYWESYVNDTTFEDIDEIADYYVGAISYAYENGVVIGKSDVAFDPNGNVTYQEALTMVVRSLGYTGLSYPNGFINKAMKLGLTNGIANVAYGDAAVRGVIATILYNALYAEDSLFADNFDLTSGTYMLVATPTVVKASGLKLPGASINGYIGKELNEGYVAFAPIDANNKSVNAADKYVYARVSQISDDLKGNFVDEHYADKLGYAFNLTFENNVLTWGDECASKKFTNYGDNRDITITEIDYDHRWENGAITWDETYFLTFGNQAYNLVDGTKADYNSPTATQDLILYADFGMESASVADYVQMFDGNNIVDENGDTILEWNDTLKAYFKWSNHTDSFSVKATAEDILAAVACFDDSLLSDYATIQGSDVIAPIYANGVHGTNFSNFNYAVAIAANYFCEITAMDYDNDGLYDAAIYTPYYLGYTPNDIWDSDYNPKNGREFFLSGVTNKDGNGLVFINKHEYDYTFTGATKTLANQELYVYSYNRNTHEINIKEVATKVSGKVEWGVKGAVAPGSLIYEDSQVSIGGKVYQVGGWYYNNLYGIKRLENYTDANAKSALSAAMGAAVTDTYYNGWNDVLDFGMTNACGGFKGYAVAGHLIWGMPTLGGDTTKYPYVIFNAYQSEFSIENDQIVVNNVIVDDSGKYQTIKINSVDSNEFTEIEWLVFNEYIKTLYGDAANLNIYLAYYFNDARREYHKQTDLYKAIEREFIIDRLTNNLVDFREDDYAEKSDADKKVTLVYAVEGIKEDGSYKLMLRDKNARELIMSKIKGYVYTVEYAETLEFNRGITKFGETVIRTNADTAFTFVAKDGIYTYVGMPKNGYRINFNVGADIFTVNSNKFMIVDRNHCIDEIATAVALCDQYTCNVTHVCEDGVYWTEKVQDVAREYKIHDVDCANAEKILTVDGQDNLLRCDYLARDHKNTWAFVEYVPYIEATFNYDEVYMVTEKTANTKIYADGGELFYEYSNLYNLVENKMEDKVIFKGYEPSVFNAMNDALKSFYENGAYVDQNGEIIGVETNVGLVIVRDSDLVYETATGVDFAVKAVADVFNLVDAFGNATDLKTGNYVKAEYDTAKKLTYVTIGSTVYYVENVEFVTFTVSAAGVKVGTFANVAAGATMYYTYNATTATLTGYAFQ